MKRQKKRRRRRKRKEVSIKSYNECARENSVYCKERKRENKETPYLSLIYSE